jgi:integrase
MPLNKFSTTDIRIIVKAGRKGLYADGGGLWLQITASGSASWIFRYQGGNGLRRYMGLGPLHTVTLAEARDAAMLARKTVFAGQDPIVARPVAAMTFDACVAEYLEVSTDPNVGWRSVLDRYASPILGKMPVAAITTEHILQTVSPIWRKRPFTADRVRRYIATVLEYADTVKAQRSGANPAAWSRLKSVLTAPKEFAKVEHHPSMEPDELPPFMVELAQRDDLAARALAFLILTVSRTGDITGQPAKRNKPAKPPLRWCDIDLDRRLWTIPEDKEGNTNFQVPLSEAAVALLRALPREGEQVFPVGKNGMWNLLGEMRPDVAVHGFRSTFRGWASKRQFGIDDKDLIVEVCMKHVVDNDEVKKAYGRHVTYLDPRARIMQRWGQFACGQEEAKVVHLRA